MSYKAIYLFISFLILIAGITYLTIYKDIYPPFSLREPQLKEEYNSSEKKEIGANTTSINTFVNPETLVAGYGTVAVFYSFVCLSIYNWGLSTQPDVEIISLAVVIFSGCVIFLKGPVLIKENGLLILASTLGIILMLEHSSLIGLYLGVEAYSLCGYCLASGFNITQKSENLESPQTSSSIMIQKVSIEAGLKYFLLSALSSGLLLAGMSLIYGCTGSFRNDEIYRIYSLYLENSFENNLLSNNIINYYGMQKSTPIFTLLYTGICLITGAMIFKIGGAPFHNWVADVYEKVSTTTTFYLILVPKIGLSYILFILTSSMSTSLIYFSALISFIVGAFGGLVQKNLIRLIAFSSINHVAYICAAIYALTLKSPIALKSYSTKLPLNENLLQLDEVLQPLDTNSYVAELLNTEQTNHFVLLAYLVIYGITTLSFFSIYYVLQNYNFNYEPHSEKDKAKAKNFLPAAGARVNNFTYIYSLKRLFYKAPYLALALTICVFSMAGVPPFAGFLAKFGVYSILLEKGCYFLAFVAVITSIVVLVFYLNIIKTLYFSPTAERLSNSLEIAMKKNYTSANTATFEAHSYSFISQANALVISLTSMIILFYPFIMQNLAYLFYFDFSF